MSRPTPSIGFTVSIDTEEDNWIPVTRNITTGNIEELPKLARLFDLLGVRATYFTTYQVASNDRAADILRELQDAGNCEIGAHLHPWNTPPTSGAEATESMLLSYPVEAQRRKLQILIEALCAKFQRAPTAFRAGRFGLGSATIPLLLQAGIRIDSSMTPLLDWEGAGKQPFLGAPFRPFRFRSPGHPAQNSDVELVEVPVTVGYTRFTPPSWDRLARFMHHPAAHILRLPGLASRLGIVRRVILSPETNTTKEMLAVSRRLMEHGGHHLHMYFHSSSLRAGLTPFTASAADVDALYARIARFIESLSTIARIEFCTVTEAAHRYGVASAAPSASVQ